MYIEREADSGERPSDIGIVYRAPPLTIMIAHLALTWPLTHLNAIEIAHTRLYWEKIGVTCIFCERVVFSSFFFIYFRPPICSLVAQALSTLAVVGAAIKIIVFFFHKCLSFSACVFCVSARQEMHVD
jgi:hypothetical protein